MEFDNKKSFTIASCVTAKKGTDEYDMMERLRQAGLVKKSQSLGDLDHSRYFVIDEVPSSPEMGHTFIAVTAENTAYEITYLGSDIWADSEGREWVRNETGIPQGAFYCEKLEFGLAYPIFIG
jgi:hypothetical protein